ncbi:MAG: hypothetical protein KDE27_22020 [Planctomycetes bacterium]|nr:hypothetical protein [Planctomycetota bacterium]
MAPPTRTALPCCGLVAVFAFASAAAAQDPASGTTPARATVAAAAQALRSESREQQLQAIEQLAAIPRDQDPGRELGIVEALAAGLASPHDAVVDAALAALWRDPDRARATAAVVGRLDELGARLRGLPQPDWPARERLAPPVPRIPPMPPLNGDAKAKRKFRKDLAAFERQQQREEREAKKLSAEIEATVARDAALIAASTELATFAQRLREVREDAIVDALLRALALVRERDPARLAGIVEALCGAARRDAVATCTSAMLDRQAFQRAIAADRDRFLAELNLSIQRRRRVSEGDGPEFRVLDAVGAMARIREHLTALGERHGIAAPEPTDAPAAAAWRRWNDELAPKLPERLGS